MGHIVSDFPANDVFICVFVSLILGFLSFLDIRWLFFCFHLFFLVCFFQLYYWFSRYFFTRYSWFISLASLVIRSKSGLGFEGWFSENRNLGDPYPDNKENCSIFKQCHPFEKILNISKQNKLIFGMSFKSLISYLRLFWHV